MKKKHFHTPTDPSQIVTGTGSSKPKFYVPAKFRLSGLIVLMIILIGAGGWYIVNSRSKKAAYVRPHTKPPTVSQQADAIASTGNYQTGQSLLDTAISKTENKAEKAKLYEDKSLIAYNHKQFQEAINYGRKAEEINPTRGSATMIAMSAEALNDKKTAGEYYHKVLERTTKEAKELDPDDYAYFEKKAKEFSQ